MRALIIAAAVIAAPTLCACTSSDRNGDQEQETPVPVSGSTGGPATPTVVARVILPADTFVPGTAPVGRALADTINGRVAPFVHNPLQGLSSLVPLGGDTYLALQDNGFGSRQNSPDVPLMWYRLQVAWPGDKAAADAPQGPVNLLDPVVLTDPDGHLPSPLPLTWPDGERPLSGADLDPESFVRLADESIWLGEEFGPWLLHFDAQGRLLAPPIDIPVPAPLADFARGQSHLRSPNHPSLLGLPADQRAAASNLPGSGGIEGLATSADDRRLYLTIEKGLLDDPICTRRFILEFDTVAAHFTGRFWFYRAETCDAALVALDLIDNDLLLITERDGGQGETAHLKRIYRADLGTLDADGFVHKTLVCDLLDLADPARLGSTADGSQRPDGRFTFPFVTPECLAMLDPRTLLVVNDNNYPFSDGRLPAGEPDNTEFILIRLPHALTDDTPTETP